MTPTRWSNLISCVKLRKGPLEALRADIQGMVGCEVGNASKMAHQRRVHRVSGTAGSFSLCPVRGWRKNWHRNGSAGGSLVAGRRGALHSTFFV